MLTNSLKSLMNKKIPFKDICLQLFLLSILSISGTAKYIICFAIVVVAGFAGARTIRFGFGRWCHRQAFWLIAPFLVITAVGLGIDLLQGQLQLEEGLKQVIMYLVPVALAAVVLHYSRDDDSLIRVQFMSTIFVFFATTVTRFNAIDLLESTAAFSFGLFALYFWAFKKKGLLFISLVCLVLANKRIVFAAVLISLAVSYSLKGIKDKKRWALFCFILFFLFVSLYLNGIYTGALQRLFVQFDINSMGRLDLYSFFSPEYAAVSSFDKLGYGLGYVINKLELINYSHAAGNLHNDWLSIFIEVGFPALATLFISTLHVIRSLPFSGVNAASWKWCALFVSLLLYWQTLWLTDNVTIYVFVLYPYYTIAFSLLRRIENTCSGGVSD